MLEIDEAIGQVESLYRAVTGKPMPQFDTPYAPIPREADPAAHVKLEMDRLIAALHGLPHPRPVPSRPWAPPVSLFESPTEVLVCVDLPGVTRERVNVTIHDGALLIEGQRALQPREGEPPRVVAEQPFGPFRRTVLLPPGLRSSELNAQLKDGVLEVRIPRSGDSGAKTVPVS
jgi:HSP20 family protein